jgi:hypothetical protein
VIKSELDLARLPQLFSLKILLDQLLRSALQVRAVVRDVDGHEPVGKDHLSLAEGNLALVEPGGSLDRSESTAESVKRLGRTGNNIVPGSVMQGYVDLRVFRKVLVCLGDLILEVGETHPVDDHHVGRDALAVLFSVLDELGLECEEGEKVLSSQTEVEELPERLEGVDVERVERVRTSYRDGSDDTLRVPGSTPEPAPHLTRSEVRDLAADQVLHQLGETDQGHRDGDRCEIFDRGSSARSVQPRDDVEAVGVVGVSGRLRLGGQSIEVLGGGSQKGLDEGLVDVVQRVELVKVDLRG